jgi:hypothetical protein
VKRRARGQNGGRDGNRRESGQARDLEFSFQVFFFFWLAPFVSLPSLLYRVAAFFDSSACVVTRRRWRLGVAQRNPAPAISRAGHERGPPKAD